MLWLMDLEPLDHHSESPLYRQLFDQIALQIRSGRMMRGTRLPATRELAGLLGLNRATVSAAYEMLEAAGLISGQVGRGSFVTGETPDGAAGVDWSSLLDHGDNPVAGPAAIAGKEVIRFVVSQPSSDLFPLDAFRASCLS